ncbi:Class I heat shock protein [Quillaja saponaria]|uniref:Class I heat shock protein n=1 Tax=Quillaja saponaria TaxID=32244 RepID=A0AAD7QG99_QUISA|nr:Class I heat shock protein [Quillaja saponaria]
MSIVPVNQGSSNGSNSSSPRDLWDSLALNLWEPLRDFPFPSSPLSSFFPEFNFGARVNTRLDWEENSKAHVWKVVLPGLSDEDVLVELQDDRMLQVSVESGKFMSRFKIPHDAKLDQLKATMNNGILIVTVPKEESTRPNLRAIEISGSG